VRGAVLHRPGEFHNPPPGGLSISVQGPSTGEGGTKYTV
jgi:hypothetical protein